MKQRRWIAPVLLVFGALDLVNGIAMFFAPATWFFRLIPGVPATGPFNAHMVCDGGTFFIAIGIGLMLAARDPRRDVLMVAVAAVAAVLHSALHIYSHLAGLLSGYLLFEAAAIYVPALVLIALSVILSRPEPSTADSVRVRAA
jgi:hypothetical protein